MNTQIQNKTSILKGLEETFIAIRASLVDETAEKVCADQGERWSIAQQFQHLILSNAAVASAMKKPYERLAAFGAPTDPTLTYDGLVAKYGDMLNKGAKSVPKFNPAPVQEDEWGKMIPNWDMIGQKLQDRLGAWPESALDQYAVPHPLLGPLSVRQILFFTILHNWHHLKRIKRELQE